MARTKKTYLEKMGLEPAAKLSKKVCLERVRHLQKLIDSGKLEASPRLLKQAKYYRGWYKWRATNDRKAA